MTEPILASKGVKCAARESGNAICAPDLQPYNTSHFQCLKIRDIHEDKQMVTIVEHFSNVTAIQYVWSGHVFLLSEKDKTTLPKSSTLFKYRFDATNPL